VEIQPLRLYSNKVKLSRTGQGFCLAWVIIQSCTYVCVYVCMYVCKYAPENM